MRKSLAHTATPVFLFAAAAAGIVVALVANVHVATAAQVNSARVTAPADRVSRYTARADFLVGALPYAERRLRALMRPDGARWARPMTGHSFVAAAQYSPNDVLIYSASGSRLPARHDGGTVLTYFETVTGLHNPDGLVATQQGDLLVVDQLLQSIPVYHVAKNGKFALSRTLYDPYESPLTVDTTLDQSLVAVSNILSDPSNSPGNVSVYTGRATTPSYFLTVPHFVVGVGVAIDKSGNCYWSVNDLTVNTASIYQFAHCSGSGTLIVSGLGYAGGLAFDKKGNLFFVDQAAGVYRCHGTKLCSLIASGFSDAYLINFDAKWQHLWVTDIGTGFIYALDPTTGSVLSATDTGGGPSSDLTGIAPIPGAKY